MRAYAGYSALLTGFVYPVVAHWLWSSDGWLSTKRAEPLFGCGVVDFAGSGVVHMVGGAAAGIGAYVLGPRIGRFEGRGHGGVERATLDALKANTPIRGHSMPLVVLGTFLLWIGWYGFNPGSTLGITGDGQAAVAARVAVTTTLAAASGGVTSLFVRYRLSRTYDVAHACNGLLAGLVSSTAGCAVIEPWAAVVVGSIGAVAYNLGVSLLLRLEIDDAVNAAPVHFFAGAWGLIVPALFARPANLREAYGGDRDRGGLFYGGGARRLAAQLVALVCITAWVAATMIPFFILFRRLRILRVSMDEEIDGLDGTKHGGDAYAIDPSSTRINLDEAKIVPDENDVATLVDFDDVSRHADLEEARLSFDDRGGGALETGETNSRSTSSHGRSRSTSSHGSARSGRRVRHHSPQVPRRQSPDFEENDDA